MKTRTPSEMTIALALLTLASAVLMGPSARASGIRFGAPLRNLPADLLDLFNEGLQEFSEEETTAEGLGPIFNNVSCAACHSGPAIGGTSAILETRFGRVVDGHFDPMTELGGSLLQDFATAPECREVIPASATIIARRQTTPLFGAGLVEAIPDRVLLAYAALPKPDGVTGRAAIVKDVSTGQWRVGRFGWKAQQATLLAFSADAYLNELGITSRFFPVENAPNGNTALLVNFDSLQDPEDRVDPVTGRGNIDRFTDFMRFLGPPPPIQLTASSAIGAILFVGTGCAYCHVPVLYTGDNVVAALDDKAVVLYSDLLLHDMGSLGDGIAQGAAGPRDMRTTPLWGIKARSHYLHDGRAATVSDAIKAHDGEGAASRNRYLRLGPFYKRYLLDFLNSI